MDSIDLFPLKTPLFPGVRLPLQIFEPRYLDMLSRCLKTGTGFGVVLIREGREVGQVPQVFATGVMANVIDWQHQPNGLLGIVVEGERKFRVRATEARADKLLTAQVDFLPLEPALAIQEHHLALIDLVQQLSSHPAVANLGLPAIADARDLGWQLTQLLPLSNPDKMALLELADPWLRLDQLVERIDRLAAD